MDPGQHLWPYLLTMFRFLLRKGLRLIMRHLTTAMQEATPDDQASDHSVEDDDFFVKKGDNSTAWWVSAESIYRDDDSHAMATHQAAVFLNKHSPVQCSWAYIYHNEGLHWRHQLWKSAFAEVKQGLCSLNSRWQHMCTSVNFLIFCIYLIISFCVTVNFIFYFIYF